MMKSEITQDDLKDRLDYDKDTGLFVWKYACGQRVHKGDIAGTVDNNGYILISIKGIKYKAHRLAWLYVHGYMPNAFIDHINRTPGDNRIGNLRECSCSENQFNKMLNKNNTSGYKGVNWNNSNKKWMATIRANNKQHYLGYFSNKEDAYKAYVDKSIELHGEFHCA